MHIKTMGQEGLANLNVAICSASSSDSGLKCGAQGFAASTSMLQVLCSGFWENHASVGYGTKSVRVRNRGIRVRTQGLTREQEGSKVTI